MGNQKGPFYKCTIAVEAKGRKVALQIHPCFFFRSHNNMSVVSGTDREFKCFSSKTNKFLLRTKPVMNADYIRKITYSYNEKPL